ncbi:MAG: hypothetical protein N4A65_15060 [Cohaesibacter sp.]|jgi:regulator of replication initiation timing|nr:hypothetical protein [Cohaesibacter sp.]
MARRGKTIFDASMMVGWAFVAGLTGMLALTVVDTSNQTNLSSGDVASLERPSAPIITGSIDKDEPATASINHSALASGSSNLPDSDDVASGLKPQILLEQQSASFDPFAEDRKQQALMARLSKQLNEMQREIEAFHTTSKRLRTENLRLRQRLESLEAQNRLEAKQKNAAASRDKRRVRVVPLPGQNSQAEFKNGGAVMVDKQATGSIRPLVPVKPQQQFDPFSVRPQANMQLKRAPMDLDTKSEKAASSQQVLPKTKPAAGVIGSAQTRLSPISKIVPPPKQILTTSQTSFALNLGQFVSLPELRSAWLEIAGTQNQIIGDLRPVTSIAQGDGNRINLNLLVGPLQNAADAAALCARLKDRGYGCNVSPFQGQALVLNR